MYCTDPYRAYTSFIRRKICGADCVSDESTSYVTVRMRRQHMDDTTVCDDGDSTHQATSIKQHGVLLDAVQFFH